MKERKESNVAIFVGNGTVQLHCMQMKYISVTTWLNEIKAVHWDFQSWKSGYISVI